MADRGRRRTHHRPGHQRHLHANPRLGGRVLVTRRPAPRRPVCRDHRRGLLLPGAAHRRHGPDLPRSADQRHRRPRGCRLGLGDGGLEKRRHRPHAQRDDRPARVPDLAGHAQAVGVAGGGDTVRHDPLYLLMYVIVLIIVIVLVFALLDRV